MLSADPIVTWPRLSALICLTRGNGVPSPLASFNLISTLAALDPETLHAACAQDQQMNTPGGLFRRGCIGARDDGATCSFLTCGNAGTFKVKLRRPNGSDPAFCEFIRPDGIVLPWSLKGDYLSAVRNKYDSDPDAPDIDEVGTLMDADAIKLEPLMKAVDLAASHKYPTTRADFQSKHGNPNAMKEWLVQTATKLDADFGCPDTFTVDVDTDVPTTSTWIGVVDGHLHLQIGWTKPPACPPTDSKTFAIRDWPCGAFVGYD